MKKITTLIIALTILCSMNTVALANDRNSSAVIIREDVSCNEAMMDSTFDLSAAKQSKTFMPSITRAIFWDVWGEKVMQVDDEEGVGYIPYGYSRHMDGSTILPTYHYTRTYLGLKKLGDSGRKWGSGLVEAKGKWQHNNVWQTTTHYVKYGTTDD